VILPKGEFIDNAHINNPCTRVQFNANACPAKSILGTARAYTPLLDKPLEGPIYFRFNGERELPDLVVDLSGQIHVTLVGFIDSIKAGKDGSRVRTRFLGVPDAPVSRFELSLYGGKRGCSKTRSTSAARNSARRPSSSAPRMASPRASTTRSKPPARSGGRVRRASITRSSATARGRRPGRSSPERGASIRAG
jgi:hypothetical protein